MRTTLDLDEDLLLAAKQLASQQQTTMGKVVSQLMRRGLEPVQAGQMRNGMRPFSPIPGAQKVTPALVNRLRDEP